MGLEDGGQTQTFSCVSPRTVFPGPGGGVEFAARAIIVPCGLAFTVQRTREIPVEVAGLAHHRPVARGLPCQPGDLRPVLGCSGGIGDLVGALVELRNQVEHAGPGFEDCDRGSVVVVALFDVHECGEPAVGVDAGVPGGFVFALGEVELDIIVWNPIVMMMR